MRNVTRTDCIIYDVLYIVYIHTSAAWVWGICEYKLEEIPQSVCFVLRRACLKAIIILLLASDSLRGLILLFHASDPSSHACSLCKVLTWQRKTKQQLLLASILSGRSWRRRRQFSNCTLEREVGDMELPGAVPCLSCLLIGSMNWHTSFCFTNTTALWSISSVPDFSWARL